MFSEYKNSKFRSKFRIYLILK